MELGKKLANILRSLSMRGKTLVGLDIGQSAVKVALVELKGNKYQLSKFVSVPLPEGSLIEDEIQNVDDISAAITEASAKIGIKPLICCFGIFGPNTVARKLQVAGGDEEEIEDQVLWEAEQYLPFDIDDSTIDFHLLGENEGGGVDVIVAAARNSIINKFKEVIEESGGVVKIVDLGILAVINVFELYLENKNVSEDESFMLLDMGAQKTYFIIYKNGVMVFSKEINVGGVMITEEIQRQMGVNYFEAEDLKTHGDEKGNLPEEILEIMDEVIEVFFSEIKKTHDFYVSSSSDESLSKIYVTGGGALIPGICEGLEALIGVGVEVLNPFEMISFREKDFSDEEIEYISYRGIQAIGLAMRRE